MADFQVLGHIVNVKHLPDCVLIFIDEYKKGYKKTSGEKVEDKVLSWRCIFSGNENKRNYINKFFNRGSLVQIKGELLPYSLSQGQMVDGYTVFIQTINLAAYPRQTIKFEKKAIKESLNDGEVPDVDSFYKSDF